MAKISSRIMKYIIKNNIKYVVPDYIIDVIKNSVKYIVRNNIKYVVPNYIIDVIKKCQIYHQE